MSKAPKVKKIPDSALKRPYKRVGSKSNTSSAAIPGPGISLNEHGACPFWGFSSDHFKLIRMGRQSKKPDFIKLFEEKMNPDKRVFPPGMSNIKPSFFFFFNSRF